MRVLVGCETSGAVRNAFIRYGHDAWSCDLLPADSDAGGRHIVGDVLDVATSAGPWDLGIFHPPCTYLCSSGMHWTRRGLRDPKLTDDALLLVRNIMDLEIGKIAIENPVGCISTKIRKPDQIIQPYQFGEDASKATCLWLKGLPKLKYTQLVAPRMVCVCGHTYRHELANCPSCGLGNDHSSRRWSNQTDSGQNRLPPSDERWKKRSKTYLGIANAMAAQWGI